MRVRSGFTVTELLVTLALVAVVATLLTAAVDRVIETGERTRCAASLRQLCAATQLYLAEHSHTFFAYSENTADGRLWFFGLEPWGVGGSEGNRELDRTQGPLYPYLQSAGSVEICRAFPYRSALWKPKFKGASYGYGFNTLLSRVNALTIEHPSRVVLFGDCAQVNTFQAPASPRRPMIEEFYMFDAWSKTAHFRHNGLAQFVFLDGHVEGFAMARDTLDTRLPQARVGRITPAGSTEYLW